jgi:poly(A) polymerase/tRNA nucleotidyltransferase (CCA-adding enzyme)
VKDDISHIDPGRFLAHPGLAAILRALPRARLVGGCVRDHLADRAIADIDLATQDRPEAVAEALDRAGLRAIPTGIAHGTVTALSDGNSFEITTLRRDVETDGRHATVAFTDDWREDAARRDFTINAMSATPDGRLFDYFGGREDLRAGRLRFVGDAATRIAEDYLRILRFFRFFARYGRGAPDSAALVAIQAQKAGLARLSAERVWSELKRILSAPTPDTALALMDRLGVLADLLPEARLAALDTLPADPLLRLAKLLPANTPDLPDRLKLSGEEAALLSALHGPVPPDMADDTDLRRALADTPHAVLIGRAWIAGRSADLRGRIAALPAPVFPLQGRDLLAAGIPPGPEMGATLRRLRALWLESGCLASAPELLAARAAP